MVEDLSEFRRELDRIERRVAGEVQVGRVRVRLLAGCIALLVVGLLLPQASATTSLTAMARWESGTVALPLRVFDIFVLAFGVLMPIVALLRRRWSAAAVATLGSGAASVAGLFAFWAQTGMDAPSPHVGLLVCWAAVVATTILWLPVVLGAPPLRTSGTLSAGVLTPPPHRTP